MATPDPAKQQAVRDRLQALCDSGGGVLTPAAVVEDARDPSSVLHGAFEWDVDKAAYQHQLDQARRLITSVKLVFRTSTMSIRSVAYVRNPDADTHTQGYVSVLKLQTDEDSARAAILDEFRRAGIQLRRARDIAISLGAEHEVDALLMNIANVQARFEHPASPTHQ